MATLLKFSFFLSSIASILVALAESSSSASMIKSLEWCRGKADEISYSGTAWIAI